MYNSLGKLSHSVYDIFKCSRHYIHFIDRERKDRGTNILNRPIR